MSSTLEHLSHPGHSLVLKEDDVIEVNAECDVCGKAVIGSPTYTCTSDDTDCQSFYLHKSCAELPTRIYHHDHHQHPLVLQRRAFCYCDICGYYLKFAYACVDCDFDACVFCVFEQSVLRLEGLKKQRSTLEHFSHPAHLLILNEDDDIVGEDDICYVCNKPVIGSPTYTCTSHYIHCESFYLHKSCAELPTIINHHTHNQHPLTLLNRPEKYLCDVCRCTVKFAYTCDDCNFNVCAFCGFGQRVLHHEGHPEHTLTVQREALFKCDACSEEAKDSSYVCITCDFWIHKKCAFSPSIIPTPTYHHHPLKLIYSIPDMHRHFSRLCAICDTLVQRHHWLYYCYKCTYFVHMKCSTSTVSMVNDDESDYADGEPNLVHFPLPNEESLFHLIITQCGKLQVDFPGKIENSITISTKPNDPPKLEQHWAHKDHPLEQLHFTENNNSDNSNDRRVLICDGCIQPITDSHPSYYACVQCGFYLHSFCATTLPQMLPAGASLFHSNHSLFLRKTDRFYSFIKCGACSCDSNGFYYQCETCDIKIDIRCAFLPSRIKHISHKHHSLVQQRISNSVCRVSKLRIIDRVGYACEICINFHIDIHCAFYPNKMSHRYDYFRDITLRQPPFFYEGVFYCEVCEEQVNNQWWLYHCSESDHSFHYNCLRWHENVKLGRTIELVISNQPHTLALVLKRTTRKNSPRYFCRYCKEGYKCNFLFECDGCGFLVCRKCVTKILG